jgi:WD40 repeat protein
MKILRNIGVFMVRYILVLIILLNALTLFPSSLDYKWIKSGRDHVGSNIWAPHVSSTGKFYIYMESYGTHFINIETGNLEKTYNLSSYFEIATYNGDSAFLMMIPPQFEIMNDSIVNTCLDTIQDFYYMEIGHSEGHTSLSASSQKLGLMAIYGGVKSTHSNQIVIFDYKNCRILDRILLPVAYGMIFLENSNTLLYSDYQGILLYDINQKKVVGKKPFINAANFVKSNDEQLIAFHRYTDPETSKLTIVDNKFLVIAEIDCNSLDNLSSFYSSFSPDNKFIAYCNNNNIEIFDIANKKRVKTIKTMFQPNFIFFCESGKSIIATNEVMGFSVLYDFETGIQKRTLVANDDEISLMKFSPDGKYIVTLGKDRNLIKLINADNGNLDKFYEITNSLTDNIYYYMDVSNSHISISSDVNEYLIIDYENDKQDYLETVDNISDVVFSPDGSKYALCTDNGKIIVLNTISKTNIYETKLEGDYKIFKLGFSSDGETLYIFSKNTLTNVITLFSWDFINLPQNMNRNFEVTSNFLNQNRYIDFINYKYLATRFFIYNFQDDIFSYDFPKYYSDGIDISKDDKTIIYSQIDRSSSEYNYFDKYNFTENTLLKRFKIDDYIKNKDFLFDEKYWIHRRFNTPHCVAFSPDNKYIAVGLYNGTLMMINNDTLETYVYDITSLDDKIITYPNPFDDKINIQIKGIDDELLKIELFDIFNTKIYELSDFDLINKTSFTLNTSSFSSGVYFLQLTFRHGKYLKKIVNIK